MKPRVAILGATYSVDVVLIADDLIFIIEFKIGAPVFDSAAVWQAMSYALPIRDVHLGSKDRRIVPILVATMAAPSAAHPGVCWGGDFVRDPDLQQWRCRRFWGSDWRAVRQQREQRYLKNKYRVLLTRARQGMIIWVPRGSSTDPTRDPASFDATAEHLKALGILEV
jgi:hypothetical protein